MTYLDLLHDRVSERENLPQGVVQFLRRHLTWVNTTGLTSSHVGNTVHFPSELFTTSAGDVEEEGS